MVVVVVVVIGPGEHWGWGSGVVVVVVAAVSVLVSFGALYQSIEFKIVFKPLVTWGRITKSVWVYDYRQCVFG